MTTRARFLNRLSHCPGSGALGDESVIQLHNDMLCWQHSRRQFPQFEEDLKDATPADSEVNIMLWLTGTLAGAMALQHVPFPEVEQQTLAGEWCEGCTAQSICKAYKTES